MGNSNLIESKKPLDITDRWRMFKDHHIGSGYFGEVFKGQDNEAEELIAVKTQRLSALKQKLNRVNWSKCLEREIKILENISEINHPNLVQYKGTFRNEEYVSIFLELCDQSLWDYVDKKGGRLPESEVKIFGLQILEGLSALHSRDIIHRDLKLDNVLLKEGVCKISDFGQGTDEQMFLSLAGAVVIQAPDYKTRNIRTVAVDI